jgi:hypothetical protein
MTDNNTVDLSLERKVAEFFYKNLDHNNGQLTPDYCLELIQRASVAEAENEILMQSVVFYRNLASEAMACIGEIAAFEQGQKIVTPGVHRARRFLKEMEKKR